MKSRARFLHRAVLSHLFVALPPALLLGVLVADSHRRALLVETHHTQIAVASRLLDALTQRIDSTFTFLETAERVLDRSEIPLEARKELLRAFVAERPIGALAIYASDGQLDTVLSAGIVPPLPKLLDPEVKRRLAEDGRAIGLPLIEDGKSRIELFVAWVRDGEVFGYLATTTPLEELSSLAAKQSAELIGEGGEVDVIGPNRVYFASSVPGRLGRVAGEGTPFASATGDALTNTGAGASLRYESETKEFRLAALASSPTLRMAVSASRPEAIALASIASVKKRVVLLSIFAALVAGFVALLLARSMTRPIHALASSVRASMKNRVRSAIDAAGTREIELLGSAFNDLLAEVGRQKETTRRDSLVQLRLARYLAPDVLREVLTEEHKVRASAKEEDVSVVYADLVDGTGASAAIEKVKLVSMLGEFFALACAAIERRGGRVDRYTGDAVIGVFTKEQANDAVAAAKDIVADTAKIAARFQTPIFSASSGIVSGRGLLGTLQEEGEISVLGALVEEAALLQKSAKSGEVVVDRRTKDAIGAKEEWQSVAAVASGTVPDIFRVAPGRES